MNDLDGRGRDRRISSGYFADLRVAALSCALFAIGTTVASQSRSKPVAKAVVKGPSFAKDVGPVTAKFCSPCHHGKNPPGGIDFAKYRSEAAVKADLATWERVGRAVSSGSMPPKGMLAPSKEQKAALVDWVERTISSDCKLADPGRVTIRRLNREEYNNTIRDLIGLDLDASKDFPSDDVGYGFDNIGDVLSISPLLMEKYLSAAGSIAQAAIVLPGSQSATYQMEEFGRSDGEYVNLNTNAEIVFDHEFKPGIYKLRIRAFEDHAGGEFSRMTIAIGAKPVQAFEVSARRRAPAFYETPYRSEGGKLRIAVGFTNDYYQPENAVGNRDRNLHVDLVEVVGPIGGANSLTNSHRRIIPSTPPSGRERDYARQILSRFASRAYRRPATAEEVERLLTVFDLAKKYQEPFERGIQLGVQATLVSPNFLFRAEVDPKSNPTASRSLNGYELATRLSYFLWSSMPDDRLLMLAGDGSLAKPAIVRQEVLRMLKSPKASALADNFAAQWLNLRKLSIIHPDPSQFPNYSVGLRDSMLRESTAFFNAVVSEDRSILDFIDGKFTFVNGELAKHYGIANVEGPEFRKVSLAGTPRAGVLTHASVLTVTSNPTRTSPTKRGRWILEQILGTPPPPPPPGADVLKDENTANSAKTLREKMVIHRQDPNCSTCHEKMDPLGFGLENFDPVGVWRTTEAGVTVDASGELPDGTRFVGPTQLRALLMKEKSKFVRAFSEKLLTYALGRGVDFADQCHVDEIAKRAAKSNYRFSAVVEAIVDSDPFKKRRTK